MKKTRPGQGLGFWAVLLLLVGVALWLRLPRMDHAMFHDEDWAARLYVHGVHVPHPTTGVLEHQQPSWKRVFWRNHFSNNHLLQTTLSRLCVEMAGTDLASGPPFSVRALRIPPLLAGLASLLVIGWMGRRHGWLAPGLLAAGLLVFHGYHLRMSTEARGYSLVFLLTPLLLGLAAGYLQRPTRGRAAGLALTSVALLLSFPGTAFVHLTTYGYLSWHRFKKAGPRAALGFLGLTILVISPILLALFPFFKDLAMVFLEPEGKGYAGVFIPPDFLSHYTLGMPWFSGDPGSTIDVTGNNAGQPTWLMVAVGFILIPILAILGWWKGQGDARSRFFADLLALAIGAGIPLFLVACLSQRRIWEGYCSYSLVPLWILVAAGIWSLLTRFITSRRGVTGLAALVVIAWAFLGWKKTTALRAEPIEDWPALIRAARGGELPSLQSGPPDSILVGLNRQVSASIDPWIYGEIKDVETLERLAQQAREQQIPMHVIISKVEELRRWNPELTAHIMEGDRFELVHAQPAARPWLARWLYRLKREKDD